MKVIALLGQKGGTGKTTVATALAVRAAQDRKNVALIDLDPQGSAAKWSKRRTEPNPANPAVAARQAFELGETLDVLEKGGADWVLIDTPGKIENAALEAIKHAHLVLIPVRPTPLDLDAVKEIKNLLAFAGDPPAYVVLNSIPAQGHKHELAREVIEKRDGLKVCEAALCQRAAYADAMITGQTAGEYEPKGKASVEIDRLYAQVRYLVNSISQHRVSSISSISRSSISQNRKVKKSHA
jgi:chromosome partitioning protein